MRTFGHNPTHDDFGRVRETRLDFEVDGIVVFSVTGKAGLRIPNVGDEVVLPERTVTEYQRLHVDDVPGTVRGVSHDFTEPGQQVVTIAVELRH